MEMKKTLQNEPVLRVIASLTLGPDYERKMEMARKTVEKRLQEFEEISASIGADAWSMLKDTVAKIMQDEGTIRYVLFQRKDNFTYKNSPAVDMMDEITAENRGLMEQKVREAIEKFEFRDVQDEIYEVAREVIYKRIFGKEDKNNADA